MKNNLVIFGLESIKLLDALRVFCVNLNSVKSLVFLLFMPN